MIKCSKVSLLSSAVSGWRLGTISFIFDVCPTSDSKLVFGRDLRVSDHWGSCMRCPLRLEVRFDLLVGGLRVGWMSPEVGPKFLFH
jgi:hypothetical protein